MAIKIKPKSFINKDVISTKATTKNSAKDAKDEMIYNGVYLIENSVTGRKYVGSSSNIDRRIKTHKQHLQKGCHNNRKLQKDYDMHGIESFKFIILEKDVAHDLLTAYEKYWIYKHDAIVRYKGYNIKFPECTHAQLKYIYNMKEGDKNAI
jgi:group I intron endonuclease